MKKMSFLILLVFIPVGLFAQFKTRTNTNIADQLKDTDSSGRGFAIFGLDPSRLHISHSYSMNYMSLGGQSLTQGLYLNTLSYQFNMPLTLTLQWGISHQPFATGNNSPLMNTGPFISAAQLKYKPMENMSIELNFMNNPNPYFYNPYYRWQE